MSYQTTMARAKAAHWEREWKYHKMGCPDCTRAARARHWGELCDRGAADRQEMLEARRRLDREREQDRQPIPGESPLWEVEADD